MTELLSVRPPVFPSVERPGPVHPSVRPIGRSVRPSFICPVGRSGPSICPSGRSVYLSAQSALPSVRSVRPLINLSKFHWFMYTRRLYSLWFLPYICNKTVFNHKPSTKKKKKEHNQMSVNQGSHVLNMHNSAVKSSGMFHMPLGSTCATVLFKNTTGQQWKDSGVQRHTISSIVR